MKFLHLSILLFLPSFAFAQSTQPTTRIAHFPHMEVDLDKHEIRIECQSLNPQMPLEFFCVSNGGSEHESVLRTPARPMHIHTALLMLGAKPGESMKYDESQKRWLPPHGDPIDIFVQTTQPNGRPLRVPAVAWMRGVKDHKPPKSFQWVFAGSRIMPDGTYAADTTGYIATTVNFEFSLIDVPKLASSANETLEYEFNPDTVPPKGTPVTMILRLAHPAQPDAASPKHP
ncbi:MAG TPA: YdjY domain-containing protein [Tepidisphaeraceae bacterium]|nr:YdjY domain-containing protein [Tepidisphaeraceae bacterium]